MSKHNTNANQSGNGAHVQEIPFFELLISIVLVLFQQGIQMSEITNGFTAIYSGKYLIKSFLYRVFN